VEKGWKKKKVCRSGSNSCSRGSTAVAVCVEEEETGRKLRRKLFKDETRSVSTTKKEKEKKQKYVGLYYHSLDNGESLEEILSKVNEGYAYSLSFYDHEVGFTTTISSDHCGISRLSTLQKDNFFFP
jgi:hypothetical protein